MGGQGQFYAALTRKPLKEWTPYEGASGTHKGIRATNIPSEIELLCTYGETFNAQLYLDLHTVIDLDGMYDLLELREVHNSWKSAALRNAPQQQG